MRRVLIAAVVILAIPLPGRGQQVARIPLCRGLTIVTAISRPEGDYESIKTVAGADARAFTIAYSAQVPSGRGALRHWNMTRVVRREDLGTATLYAHTFHSKGSPLIPGSTALGVSTALLRALTRTGTAKLGLVAGENSGYPADRAHAGNFYDYEETWTLQRVATTTLRVTVNDTVVALPVVQVRGSFIGSKVDFWFLDDEENPLAIQYAFASSSGAPTEAQQLRVVKVTYRCSGTSRTASEERMLGLERALRDQRRAVIYDLFFDFDSDRIREESEPTLTEIAQVLRRNPDWRLAVEGHTDDVASDAYNLELSGRRAAAVKTALGSRFGIAGARLTTAGLGESRPRDRNDTLEGRARNRRVELVRR